MPSQEKGTSTVFIDRKRSGEDADSVFFPVRVTREGVINQNLQPLDEVKKAVPFWDGVPVTIEHPADQITIQDYSLIVGVTRKMKGKVVDGLFGIQGEAGIRKDVMVSNGDAAVSLVDHIEGEGKVDVSQGFIADFEEEEGELDGEKYYAIRRNILPQHLAILLDSEPACAQPQCGIGADARKNRKVFIGGPRFKDHIYGPAPSQKGDLKMTDSPGTTDGTPLKNPAAPIAVSDMGWDSLVAVNPCAQKAQDAMDASKDEKAKMQEELDNLKKEVDGLKKDSEELAKIREAEVDDLRKKVMDAKIFEGEDGEKMVKEMSKDELQRHILTIEKLTGKGDNADEENSQTTTTPQVRVPPQADSNENKTGFTVGVPGADGKWTQ